MARFHDSVEQAYVANLIAENLYSQVDHEGHHFTLMKEIIDHDVSETTSLKYLSRVDAYIQRGPPRRDGECWLNGKTARPFGRF